MNHQTANDILGEKGFKLRAVYQEQGVDWMLAREWEWNPSGNIPKIAEPFGGILADEMGLGKTIQTIAVMETNLMPNTLISWGRTVGAEIRKFSMPRNLWCVSGNYLL